MVRGRTRERPGISGIVAALILFVMLFTVGTGYFLWVSDNNQVYSQALVDRNNLNQAQQSESLSLTPSVAGGDIDVVARNTGGVPIIIASIMVTDFSSTKSCTSTISPACGQGINPGGLTLPIDTTYHFIPGTSVTIKVLTQRGSVFSTLYLSPTLSTVLSATSIPAGGFVFDTAKLTGASGTASGTVTYYFSTTNSCPTGTATKVGQPVSVANGNVPNSASQQISAPGTYYWYAVYSGDTNDASAISPCETLTVGAATGVTISTQLSSQVVSTGQPVYDTAILSGATSNAGGTVTYEFFSGSACSGTATVVGSPVTVTSAVVPNSTPVSYVVVGSYSWNAIYSGDANNNNNIPVTSPCEPLVVQTPGTGGTLSSGVGWNFNSFKWFSAGSCSPIGSSTNYAIGQPPTNSCTLTPWGINKAPTAYTISIGKFSSSTNPNLIFGVNVSDSDTQGRTIILDQYTQLWFSYLCPIDLGSNACGSGPHGQIGTYYYGLVDVTTCRTPCVTPSTNTTLPSAKLISGQTVTLFFGLSANNLGTPLYNFLTNQGGSPSITPVFMFFHGTIEGTAFGEDIPLASTLWTTAPIVTTSLSATSIPMGGSVFDTAMLNGITSNAGGTVQYEYFTSGTCSGTAHNVGAAVTVTNGVVPNSASQSFSTAGSYGWQAVYSGDANNVGATSACEPLTVNKASPSLSTALSATTITAGSSVTDTATLSGGSGPTGTITFAAYFNSPTCTGSPAYTSNGISVSGNGAYVSAPTFVPKSPGTYYWQAAYSGDANNGAITTACGGTGETLTVNKGTAGIDPNAASHPINRVGSTTSTALTISTTNTNDIIYACEYTLNTGLTLSISSSGSASGLSWTQRALLPGSGNAGEIACWWAPSSATISGGTITFTSSSSSGGTVAYAFAISGASMTTPFDPNVGTASTSSGSSGAASASVVTTNANDLIIGVVGLSTSQAITSGGGYTTINIVQSTQSGASEYRAVSTSGTFSAGFTFTSTHWVIVVDAIDPPSSLPPVNSTRALIPLSPLPASLPPLPSPLTVQAGASALSDEGLCMTCSAFTVSSGMKLNDPGREKQ